MAEETPKSFWTGSISFGLVNIPVRLFTAVQRKDVHFHLVHKKDGVRLKQKLICPADKQEVKRTEAERGFELSEDKIVMIDDKDLEALAPKARRTIELIDFVPLEDIDSMFFDQPYYLVPEKNAGKAYRLFLQALERTDRVGIGTFVMREKQYLAALRPLGPVVCLETMYYADELVPTRNLKGLPTNVAVDPRELSMAERLIRSLSKNFRPEQYRDEHRDAVLAMIRDKAKGKAVVEQPLSREPQAEVKSLLAALEASLSHAKRISRSSDGNGHGNGHTNRLTPKRKPDVARKHVRHH